MINKTKDIISDRHREREREGERARERDRERGPLRKSNGNKHRQGW